MTTCRFKTAKGGSFSDAATNALIRRMHASKKALDGTGWIDPDKSKREGKVCVITAHGTARSGFRTWAKDDRFGNNRKYDQEAAELCLLHSKASDDYHGAYDRARLSTERQRLMDDWGGGGVLLLAHIWRCSLFLKSPPKSLTFTTECVRVLPSYSRR